MSQWVLNDLQKCIRCFNVWFRERFQFLLVLFSRVCVACFFQAWLIKRVGKRCWQIQLHTWAEIHLTLDDMSTLNLVELSMKPTPTPGTRTCCEWALTRHRFIPALADPECWTFVRNATSALLVFRFLLAQPCKSPDCLEFSVYFHSL